MAYFQTKKVKTIPLPVPSEPGYVPPAPPTPPAAEDGEAPEIIRPGLSTASNITLYKCYDENEKVDKTLNNAITFSGALIEDTDILHPTLKLETNADLTQYNYAYIDTTHRYYFMHVICLPDSRFRLVMDVDALTTFKDSMRQCVGVLSRCEDPRHYDEDLNDDKFAIEGGCAIKLSHFHPATGDKYFLQKPTAILVASGGIVSGE